MESLDPLRRDGLFIHCENIISQPLAFELANKINMYQHVLASDVPPSPNLNTMLQYSYMQYGTSGTLHAPTQF